MNAPDLLPCPFCGGPASIHKGMQAFDDFEVHCDPCGMCGPNFGSMGETLTPKEDAIAAWNTRADLADALAAALREIASYDTGATAGLADTAKAALAAYEARILAALTTKGEADERA